MCSMPSFRGEVKPIPSHHFTECKNHFKVWTKYFKGQIHNFLHQVPPHLLLDDCW
jgi:hypothetical protein